MARKTGIRLAALLCSGLLLGGCGGADPRTAELDPDKPISISVWHYYNGAQQDAFDALVSEFNNTVGAEQGIVVQASGLGTISDLSATVLDAAAHKVGADELPNIFGAYADTVYSVDQLGMVADIAPYFTEEELAAYVPGYISEGRFADDGSLKLMPVAKATELLMLNRTDWQPFADATGAQLSNLATIEGLTETAGKYYEWTDAQTPDISGDGRAFFGRDAVANYMLVGAKQLGHAVYTTENGVTTLDFDEDTMRRLWDNYYVPFVKGWFAAAGRFRSDDVKLGTILGYVGSSSSATYFPDAVIVDDEHQYPIEVEVLPAPQFAGGTPTAVQQGAGMVVTQTEDETAMYASVVFLKWFTDPARNCAFAINTSYLPVQTVANDADFIRENAGVASEKVSPALSVALQTVQNNEMYTPRAFAAATEARRVLDDRICERAVEDRAQVEAQLAAGVPYEQAIAPYTGDEAFYSWFYAARDELSALLQEEQ